nr:hypothetical protein Iba_scaffold4978CG0020 [Ipomoea batatas]
MNAQLSDLQASTRQSRKLWRHSSVTGALIPCRNVQWFAQHGEGKGKPDIIEVMKIMKHSSRSHANQSNSLSLIVRLCSPSYMVEISPIMLLIDLQEDEGDKTLFFHQMEENERDWSSD